MSKTIDIGEDETISGISEGDTYTSGGGVSTEKEAEWIDEYDSEYGEDDVVAAVSQADPGAAVVAAGAQGYEHLHFSGTDARTAKFSIQIDYDVSATTYGSSCEVLTQAFAYDLSNQEWLEKDKISPASLKPTALGFPSVSGTTTEDVFVSDIEQGDHIGVGVRVKTAAGSAGASYADADAYKRIVDGQGALEYVALDKIEVEWQ